MKKIIAIAIVLASVNAVLAAESAKIRVDTRIGLQGGKVATGIEAVGEPDGSLSSVWVTTNEVAGVKDYVDGWLVRKDDGTGLMDWFGLLENEAPDHDVLLLNEPKVIGGRLVADETWETGVVRVVRHNVVIPSGMKLVIDPEAIVKFTEEARIVVEEGGELIAKGSWFAELQDDEWVGGDTNLDGTNSVATGTQDWIVGMDPADYVHVLMLDGAEQIFPTRTYTRGQAYGELPTVDRYDEGFFFRGWVTNQEDTVGVAVDQLAEMDQHALYCLWESIYLNLSDGLVEFAAYSVDESHVVEVDSNDKWICSTDVDWLHVEADVQNGTITITADQNRSELPRSATIKVSRENGKLEREVSVVQAAMEHAAMPEIVTANGDTFSDYMAQVVVKCVTPGVAVFYTTDGSEPSVENGIQLTVYPYEKGMMGVMNIYKSTTIKAIAVRYDLLDSAITSRHLIREATLAEAMDIPELYVTTDGDAEWRVVTDVTSDGVSAVRSGEIRTSKDKRRYSRLYTYVEGQGTLTFKWKVSCERDLTGHCDWDYLAFIADGTVVKKIEGDVDWVEVSHTFTGSGAHVIQWVYTKNAGFSDFNPGEDCGWIDQVAWTPTIFTGEGLEARELYVNPSWLLNVGIVGATATDADLIEAAKADDDGDGYTNEEEGILGTDPKDPNSKLRATIRSENGMMKVEFAPDNNASKTHTINYRVLGVTELGGDWKDVTSMSDAEREYNGFRFFKIKVEIEKK